MAMDFLKMSRKKVCISCLEYHPENKIHGKSLIFKDLEGKTDIFL